MFLLYEKTLILEALMLGYDSEIWRRYCSVQQDFQRKREVIDLMRDSLREFQAKQIDLKLTEIQSNWDLENWNGILSRQETEDLLKEEKDCLLILLSPPEISLDAPVSIRNNLKIELNSVEAFLAKYYSERDKLHLVKFYSDYFKRPIGNINVEQLHKILAPVPTAILDMGVTDYAYTVNVHFWGVQNNQRRSYSSQEWNWEKGTKDLMSKGVGEKDALRMIRQTIVTSNKLLAAYIADLYYLNLDPYYQLKLPKIAAELNQSGLDKESLNPYLTELKNIQKNEQQVYGKELKVVADEVNEEETIKANAQKWKLASTLSGHSSWVRSVAFTPDGLTVASSSDDKTIKLWDLKTGQLLSTLEGHSNWVRSIAISPDNQTIASGSDDTTIKLWNLKTAQQLIYTIKNAHSDDVNSLTFSPDGKILASGSYDKTIKVWKPSEGHLIHTLEGHSSSINSIKFSPDGEILASGSDDKTIKIWNPSEGKLIRTLGDYSSSINCIKFSPDGKILASCGYYDTTIKLWNPSNGQLISVLVGDSEGFHSIIISHDGKTLISGGVDDTIKLWNLKTRELICTLNGHSNDVFSLAFSPNGHTLLSGSSDRTIKIWQDN